MSAEQQRVARDATRVAADALEQAGLINEAHVLRAVAAGLVQSVTLERTAWHGLDVLRAVVVTRQPRDDAP